MLHRQHNERNGNGRPAGREFTYRNYAVQGLAQPTGSRRIWEPHGGVQGGTGLNLAATFCELPGGAGKDIVDRLLIVDSEERHR